MKNTKCLVCLYSANCSPLICGHVICMNCSNTLKKKQFNKKDGDSCCPLCCEKLIHKCNIELYQSLRNLGNMSGL